MDKMFAPENIKAAKAAFCAAIGFAGGILSHVMGGWTVALQALVAFMAADYVTGLIVAGLFHASPKSKHGGLESKAGWKGLARKFVTLLIVMAAHQMDLLMGVEYIRDTVITGFCANEGISILENAGLMGLPIPGFVVKVLDQLQDKANGGTKNDYESTNGV